MEVLISDRQSQVNIDITRLKEKARAAMALVGLPEESELSISLVGDREMAELNLTYREREGPTNVLSFDLSGGEPEDAASHALGDIVISVETCLREAKEGGVVFERRLLELLVHGLLHLAGRHHHSEEELKEIERLTGEVVEKLINP